MKADHLHITDAEMEIMSLLWRFETSLTVADIGKLLPERQMMDMDLTRDTLTALKELVNNIELPSCMTFNSALVNNKKKAPISQRLLACVSFHLF